MVGGAPEGHFLSQVAKPCHLSPLRPSANLEGFSTQWHWPLGIVYPLTVSLETPKAQGDTGRPQNGSLPAPLYFSTGPIFSRKCSFSGKGWQRMNPDRKQPATSEDL